MGWRPTLRAPPEPARASGHSGLLRRPREPLFRHASVPACPHQQGLVRSWRTLAPARRVEGGACQCLSGSETGLSRRGGEGNVARLDTRSRSRLAQDCYLLRLVHQPVLSACALAPPVLFWLRVLA